MKKLISLLLVVLLIFQFVIFEPNDVAKGAVTITISGPTSTNANVQTSYSASISGYSATNFEWDWDPGVGGNTYIKTTYQTYSECDITWNSPGTKTITVTYVNIANGTTYSQTKTVTVNAPAPPTITTTSPLNDGETGKYYEIWFTAIGGTGTGYTWSLYSGNLPPGLTLSPSGELSGYPTTAGPYTFTVKVKDSANNTATSSFSLSVYAPLTITTSSLQNGKVGEYYSASLSATGGSGGYTWSYIGSLPNGLTLSSSGTLSGTPTAYFNNSITFQVTDSKGHYATKSLNLTINYPSLTIITSSPLSTGRVGEYYSTSFSASGGTGTGYNWSLYSGNLPPGLTLSPSGVLSGTPTTAGPYTFTVKVKDSANNTATSSFSLSVYAPLTITTSSLQNGKVGEYYSASLSATGGSGGYTWSLYYSDLPSNLTLSPSGTISGTPTTANSYSFTVQVKDSANNTATKSFSITITSNLTITTSSLPNGTVGQSYSATLQTTGAYGSVTWTITSGSLPSGVTLNNSTGVISGTPTVSGPFNITVQAKDSGNNSTTKSFSFTINSSITITTNTLSNGTTGQSYSQTLQATGGTGTGYNWSLYSGSLPPDLTLSPSGVLSGTPTTAGPYTFTVKVTDSANNYATKSFSITITSNLTITTSSLPNGTVGQSYSATLQASGEYGSVTWSVISGGLPNGVNLNSGTGQISGTPTNAGPCNVTIQVKDSGNNIATKDFSFTIYSTLSITTTSVSTGIVNQSYSATLQATGGSGGYTWSLYSGNLPNGLTLSPSGTISGTPTEQGQFDFSVMVTDSLNNYATQAFTMIINGVLTITTNTLPDGFINQSYTQILQATGGTGTGYTWSLYSGNLPPGLTLSPSGTISGTPTTAGPYSFTVKVKDSANNTATKNFTMQILEGKIIASFTASPSSDSNNPLPSGTTVTLSWSTQGINNVKLYSSTDGTNWNIIGTYPGNSSTTVSPGTTIYYKITDESDASINKTVIVYVTNGISATESLNPSSGTVNSIISVTVSGAVTNNGDPYSNTLNIKIDATSLNWGSVTITKPSGTSQYSYTFQNVAVPSSPGNYPIKIFIGSSLVNSVDFVATPQTVNTSITLETTSISIAQGTSNRYVNGILKDANNNPVQNATISVSVTPSNQGVTCYVVGPTNAYGEFTVSVSASSSATVGNYSVQVSFNGSGSYNSSSTTLQVAVTQAATLQTITATPPSIELQPGMSQTVYLKAFDSNNNDITSSTTFSVSLSEQKGSLTYLGSDYFTYTADSLTSGYSITITVQGTFNNVSKTITVPVNVSSSTIVVNITNLPINVPSQSQYTFNAQVTLNGTQDVTNNSTITWTIDAGNPTSFTGKNFAWTSPSVSQDTPLTIRVDASYILPNGNTIYGSYTAGITVKSLQGYTLTVEGSGLNVLSGILSYTDPITYQQKNVSVQGGGTFTYYTSDGYPAKLQLTLPNAYKDNQSSLSLYNYNARTSSLTGNDLVAGTKEYNLPEQNSTLHVDIFQKLVIQSATLTVDQTSKKVKISATVVAWGNIYNGSSKTVSFSRVALNEYSGPNPSFGYTITLPEVSLQGGNGNYSAQIYAEVSLDEIYSQLAPGHHEIYAIIEANIKNWGTNSDRTNTNNVGIDVTANGWKISQATPNIVIDNKNSSDRKYYTTISIENYDSNGNAVAISRPNVEVTGVNGTIEVWTPENTNPAKLWYARFYPFGNNPGNTGNFVVHTGNAGDITRTFMIGNVVPPPFTISLYTLTIQEITQPAPYGDNYQFTLTADAGVVGWYSLESDNVYPILDQCHTIDLTASVRALGQNIGSLSLQGVTLTAQKELFSSGVTSSQHYTLNIQCTLPKALVTQGTKQEVTGYALLGFSDGRATILATLDNSTTTTIDVYLNATATRTDAAKIDSDYGGLVGASDSAGATGSITIPLDSLGGGDLIVVKEVRYGDGTTEPLSNVSFTVTDANGGTHTAVTDATGRAYFTNLPLGTATVRETVPAGYTADEELKTVDITENSVAQVTFTNSPSGCAINIHKFNDNNNNGIEDPGEAASNIVFTITGPENYTVSTDANGNARVVVKTAGDYTIAESVPANYTVDSNPKSLRIGQADLLGGSFTVTFRDVPSGGTIVIKKYEDTNKNGVYDQGEPLLPNAQFEISSGNNVYTATTDVNGTITVNVVPGIYNIVEVAPPPGYNGNYSGSVTVNAGDVVTVYVPNTKASSATLLITKKDQSGNPMPGIQFSVSGGSFSGVFTTDVNGEIRIAITQPATYLVTEYIPNGYNPSPSQTQSIYISQTDINNSAVKTVSFINVPITYSITVFKFYDSNKNGIYDSGDYPLAGVAFEVRNSSGQRVATGYTGNDGLLTLVVPSAGTYTVSENSSLYTVSTGNPRIVTLTNSNPTANVSFGNYVAQATLLIIGFVDANGNGIMDSGEVQLEVRLTINGASGYLTPTQLTVTSPGSFTVVATTPAGYTPTTPTTQTATFTSADISNGSLKTLYFGFKIAQGTIIIHKFVDSNGNGIQDAGEPNLSNVVFNVAGPGHDQYVNVNITTDENGNASIVVPVTDEPDYQITEYPPYGYTPLQTVAFVTVEANKTTIVNFANIPNGCTIIIHKYEDANGNGVQDPGEKNMGGVSFTITGPNSFTSTVLTNANGDATVVVKYPGVYTITENVPANYTNNNPTQQVSVLASDLASGSKYVVFANVPQKPRITIYKFNDANGNGLQDSGETGLAGFTFLVTYPDGSEYYYQTGSDGSVTFLGNGTGLYTIEEIVPSNYTCTTGTVQTVNITQPGEIRSVTFGNKLKGKGTIKIIKFYDLNENGVLDNNETRVDATFRITGPNNFDQTVTTSSGYAELSVTDAGLYTITETAAPAGFVGSYTGSVSFTQAEIDANTEKTITIPNLEKKVTITIRKYRDANNNNVYDASDTPESGVQFTVTSTNALGIGSQTVVLTNASGVATVQVGIAGGSASVTITETVPSGETCITQNPITATINSDSTFVFLNKLSGSAKIQIFKFVDLNGDGTQDSQDTPQQGVVFTVTGPNGFSRQVTTNSSGYALVDNITTAGTYTVTETVPSNFRALTPTKTITITAQNISNSDTINVSFANAPITYCNSNATVTPPFVVTYTKADDNYNKITIVATVGKIEDPLHYPGATTAFLTIPQEQGMKEGLNNVSMQPDPSSKDGLGFYHRFTYTWYDVEDPKLVPDNTIRTGTVRFVNPIFGQNFTNCNATVTYTVKNPTYHTGSIGGIILDFIKKLPVKLLSLLKILIAKA